VFVYIPKVALLNNEEKKVAEQLIRNFQAVPLRYTQYRLMGQRLSHRFLAV
jgi:hypothetical protein